MVVVEPMTWMVGFWTGDGGDDGYPDHPASRRGACRVSRWCARAFSLLFLSLGCCELSETVSFGITDDESFCF